MSVAFARALRVTHALIAPRGGWTGERERVRRILVGGQMGIGNMVMFTPLLRALRAGFPRAHVAVAFWKRNGADEVVAGSPWVDEIIHLDSDELPLARRVLAGARLGRRGWDMGIVRFNGFPVELQSAFVFGRVPFRVGHSSGADWTSGTDHLLNVRVPMAGGRHEVERYLAIADALGLPIPDRRPTFPLADDDLARGAAWLPRLGLQPGERFVALQPGTSPSQAWKRWPAASWRALVKHIEQLGVRAVAFGSADERPLLEEIGVGTGMVNAAGRTDLRETAALLRHAAALVCTDSSLMHIGAAVGTPLVALFGPTDHTRTAPYGEGHVLLHTGCSPVPCLGLTGLRPGCQAPACMERISPARVGEELRSLLFGAAERRGQPAPSG